ncbi:MAG: dihydrodipicolinate reductase [Dinoroseobacter sp.]|nr:dihydrodipicolinate reductase [Dinoroseobacter sp.]MDJ0993450.1 dihydrodipicolinate reductase [Dinoroseobacter sp.]
MRPTQTLLGVLVAAGLSLAGGSAVAFERVTSENRFVELVEGKSLSLLRPLLLRASIVLEVSRDGDISGTALRKPVTGAWQWRDGFFCRDLAYGDKDLGPNCQVVEIKDDQIRFIADQGLGDRADFRLKN